MRKLLLFTLLVGCGLYTGSEGVVYNPDTMTGFRTAEFDKAIEEARRDAYEAGKSNQRIPDTDILPDNSTTLVTGSEIAEYGGGMVANVLPYGGAIQLVLSTIFGLLRRRRKQA